MSTKDGSYGDSRVFINFVRKRENNLNINFDLKKYITFLDRHHEFEDMPDLYMSGVEMGVEQISVNRLWVLQYL